MSEATFTPGPWINTRIFIEDNHGNVIASGVDSRNAPVITAAPDMYAKLDKLATWLEELAKRSKESAETCRFESLNEAYRADTKNYAATAKDVRSVLAKARGEAQ